MEPRTLLRSLAGQVRPSLATQLRAFRIGTGSSLVKIYYGNRDLHYEASVRPREKTIEIGLHFEADDLTNARLLGAFRTHERAIHRALQTARLQEWDKGWTRIWEPIAYERRDAALRDLIAQRLARYITTLEPILRAELPVDVTWSLSAQRQEAAGTTRVMRERSSDRQRRARADVNHEAAPGRRRADLRPAREPDRGR